MGKIRPWRMMPIDDGNDLVIGVDETIIKHYRSLHVVNRMAYVWIVSILRKSIVHSYCQHVINMMGHNVRRYGDYNLQNHHDRE